MVFVIVSEFLSSLDVHATANDDTNLGLVTFRLCNHEITMMLVEFNDIYHFSTTRSHYTPQAYRERVF